MNRKQKRKKYKYKVNRIRSGKEKAVRTILGLIMALTGAILILQEMPIFFWYGLLVLLILILIYEAFLT